MDRVTKKAYGKDIVIRDARENFNLEINEIYGNTEQDTTGGKNLLDCSGLKTQTTNGVTFTPVYDEKGLLEYINANGTATAQARYSIKTITLSAGSYTLNGSIGGSKTTYYIITAYIGTCYSEDKTATLSDDTSSNTAIIVESGTTVNNVKFYPMIRLATITDGTYEPFTNGASPNPNYPQEIESVVLSEIKTCKKNLYNPIDVTHFVINTDGTEKADNNYDCTNFIKFSNAITVKCDGMGGTCYLRIGVYDENKSFIKRIAVTDITSATTITEGSYIKVSFENDSTNYPIGLQIEQSTTATEYEPYTESVATLSGPITLNGLNGVSDYVDVKRGVLVQKFKYERILGSNITNLNTSEAYAIYGHSIATNIVEKSKGLSLSNRFIGVSYDNRVANVDIFRCYLDNNGQLTFRTSVSDNANFADLETVKAYFDSNEIYVLYELATPVDTPLADADLEVLKSLETVGELTYIFTDSEMTPYMEVEYTLVESKTDWTGQAGEYFNVADYNRIVGNITYLKAYLNDLFAGLKNISAGTEETIYGIPYASKINAIEQSIEQLNIQTYNFNIGETQEYMANTRTIDWVEFNRIESAIFMLAEQMINHKENKTRLAFTLGNQKGIRV